MRTERLLATVLFTDIVGSTERAAELGDRRWRDLLQEHHALVRRELERFGGREINTAGDGFVAAFDRPEQAIRSACAIRDAVRELGLEIRSGLHCGEVQVMDQTLGGIAVHIGARVVAHAASGEVLVSSTVHDLVAGSGIDFVERGTRVLKGVPGEWRLFAVATEAQRTAAALRTRRLNVPVNWIGRAAAAALVAAIVVGAGWWFAKRGAVPAVQASPTSLAVLPFSVRGSAEHSYLAQGMVELLSTKLDGAGALRSVDPRAVLGVVDAHREEANDPARAHTIAERLGAGLYILGSVVEAGDRLHLEATLYDPTRGSRAVAHATAEGEAARLFELVDELAGQLLAGQAGGPGARVARIAAVTTSSLPALKAYLKGESDLRTGRFREAVEAFQEAVTSDSLFALAWYRLSVAAEWATREDLWRPAAERAVRHSSRLSEHDRHLLEALLTWRRGEAADAERLYRAILTTHPEEVEAWLQLGEVLIHYGPPAGRSISHSREAWERMLLIEPEHVLALMHLARVAAVEGRRSELDSLVTRIIGLSPEGDRISEVLALRAFALADSSAQNQIAEQLSTADDVVVFLAVWNVAANTPDLGGALRLARLLTDPSRNSEGRALGYVLSAHLELARGRWSAARTALAAAEAIDPASAIEHQALLATAPFLPVDAAALSGIRGRLARLDLDAVPPNVTPSSFFTIHNDIHPHLKVYLLGLLSARVGEGEGAARHAAELERLGGSGEARALARNLGQELRSLAALQVGRREEALATLERPRASNSYNRAISSPFYSQPSERYLRAKLLNDVGRDEDALRWFSSFAEHSIYDVMYVAPSHYHRGEIHARRGERGEAVRHYRRFIELWQGCDPELKSQVEEAKRKLAQLQERLALP